MLMGQVLSILNKSQPVPEAGTSWENWFVGEIQILQAQSSPKIAPTLQKIASMVHRALDSSSYNEVDEELRKVMQSLQILIGEGKMGIITDNPQLIGKQVVYREYQDGKQIIYGRIESSLVFPLRNDACDKWVVKVREGFKLNAASKFFILYSGPGYQPGEQVLYLDKRQRLAATIVGPGFGMRGCFGYNIVFANGGKQEYRYAVTYKDLSQM
jgi:hypothetical protein